MNGRMLVRPGTVIDGAIKAGASPRGVNVSTTVILSAAKDLRSAQREILRCAQDDSWRAGSPRGVDFRT